MKTHYTLRYLFFTLTLLAGCVICCAQGQIEFLTANNVNAGIGVGGNLFSNTLTTTNTFGRIEVPKGSSKGSVFTAALWLTATDAGNNLKCAAQRYCATGHDFFDGPIMPTYNAAYDSFFNRVFKVTRTQVELHKTKFQQLGTGMAVTNVDTSLLYWPAKNNPYIAADRAVAIQSKLAPFFDADADGSYDPVKGDYPLICGDEAIFFVFNDVRAAHGETGGLPLGVEVRGLAEVFLDTAFGGFNAPPPAKRVINNTVFVRYEIENKSANPLFNLNAAMFTDVDLGCFTNDRLGCDTNRNLAFVYNGTAIDYDCVGVNGYGTLDIAYGVKRLNGRYSSFNYLTNGGTYDNDPSTPAQYNNFVNGLWADGVPFREGGNGRGGSIDTKYIYPGNPSNPNDWTEVSANIQMGDRRMVAASEYGSLPAGNTFALEYAFIASMDSSADNFTIVDTLKKDADEIQAFYNNILQPCRAQQFTTGMAAINALAVSVYPNPANSQLIVQSPEAITQLQLSNLLGQVVFTSPVNSTKQVVDVSAMPKGIYLLKIKAGVNEAVKKVVVE